MLGGLPLLPVRLLPLPGLSLPSRPGHTASSLAGAGESGNRHAQVTTTLACTEYFTTVCRIFPPAAVRTASPSSGSDSNSRLAAWYTEKCRMDKAWCDTP